MAKSTKTSKASPSRSPPAKLTQWGLLHAEGCMAALDLEGKGPDLLQVATCLNKQYPHLTPCLQPLYDRSSLLVQVIRNPTPIPGALADLEALLESGLRIGNRTAVFRQLLSQGDRNSSKNMVEFKLEGVRMVEDIRTRLEKMFAKWGKLLGYQAITHAGTEVPTGEARIVLDLGEQDFIPNRTLLQLGIGNKITCYPVNVSFCKLCRSRRHSRDACAAAPQCSKCTSRQHSAQHCTSKTSAKPPTPSQPIAEDTTSLHNSKTPSITASQISFGFNPPVIKPKTAKAAKRAENLLRIFNGTTPAPDKQLQEQPSNGPANGIQSMQVDRCTSEPEAGRNDDHRSKRSRDKSRSQSPNT